ncbi:MAG: hypothetical protein EBZ67_14890, partial [Chitinophagia bacterium]|nr:hypothetical protein [Chitinophagia bacterium]
MKRILFASFALALLYACHSDAGNAANIEVRIRHAIHRKVLIETLPGEGREAKILDSATLRSNDDVLEFHIPLDE